MSVLEVLTFSGVFRLLEMLAVVRCVALLLSYFTTLAFNSWREVRFAVVFVIDAVVLTLGAQRR